MYDKNQKICRLCLRKICYQDSIAIEKATVHMLEVLFLSLNLDICKEPMMCNECANNVQTLFNFKSACLKTEDRLLPLVSSDQNVQVDLNDVLELKSSENQNVCRLCLEVTQSGSFIYLQETKENLFVVDMLHRHIPEINLSITKEPIACLTCSENMKSTFTFITNCFCVEKQIMKYVTTTGVNSSGLVDLRNVIKSEINNQDSCNNINIVKIEPQYEKQEDGAINVGIKTENFVENDNLEMNVKKEDSEIVLQQNINESLDNVVALNLPITGSLNKYKLCTYETNKRKELRNHLLTNETDSKATIYTCEKCSFNTRYRANYYHHTITHKDSSELTMYKCESCPFETKHRKNLNRHVILHQADPPEKLEYLCRVCTFKTNNNAAYERHRLTHKINNAESKPTHFNCEVCSFRTKYRPNLYLHMVVHRDPSEVTMHKCEICTFQTKHKKNLKKHTIVHQSESSEVPAYICEVCAFKTNNNTALSKHMLNHKEQLGTSMYKLYKCQLCEHETSYRSELDCHMLIHKDPEETVHTEVSNEDEDILSYKDPLAKLVYRCTTCSYETKIKSSFRTHILKHKDLTEVTMHRCQKCSYESKHKSNVERHMVIHKDPSKIVMHQCKLCVFETKYKSVLSRHMLTHEKPTGAKVKLKGARWVKTVCSEVQIFKCDHCLYESRYKDDVRKHMLIHKDPSEVEMFRCDICKYETKYKTALNRHALKHKDPSEVMTYKCEVCPHRTKYKDGITRHMLTHKKEATI